MTEEQAGDPIDQAFNEAFDSMFDAAFSEWEQEDDEHNANMVRGELMAAGEIEEGIADMFETDEITDKPDVLPETA
jgi:hypothetical protein